ncbi:MAG TPA: putative lipid II flippase FtsW, partial [Actinomycetota bacterium]|nr:putative lipid II flippase FtsW [Actinomycetota bacterium]
MATHEGTLGAGGRAAPARASSRVGHSAMLVGVVVAALVLLGLVMILSASSVSSFATYGSSFLFFNKQLVWAAVGLVGFVAAARLDYHRLRGAGYVALPVVVLLLAAVLVPGVGVTAGGSSRWIGVGPFTLQPSELAKLALILFAADVFARKKESTFRELGHTLVPLVPALGMLAALVMLQPDLGTTLLIGGIGIGMLFVAGAPLRHIVPVTAVGAGAALVAAFGESYRRDRILAFLDPWADPFNTGYQTIQSLIAIGSGGWFGVGLGASRQKWSYVPNAHTDFIYAIFGEETGVVGTLVVLGMFVLLAYLGVRAARNAPDRFGMLLAAGITTWVSLQAIVNMGAVTASLPITGVPLPLVSFGGSSLVVTLVAMGILTNVASQEGRPAPEPREGAFEALARRRRERRTALRRARSRRA